MNRLQVPQVHRIALGIAVAGAVGALTSPATGGLLVILAILARMTVLELTAPQADDSGPPA